MKMGMEVLARMIKEADLRDDFLAMAKDAYIADGRCLICCTPGCAISAVTVT